MSFSIKSGKTQLAPNITSSGFSDQLLPDAPLRNKLFSRQDARTRPHQWSDHPSIQPAEEAI